MAFNIKSRVDEIFNSRKDRETEKLSALREKINSAYGNANPFVKNDGSLVNPYINYQQVLDNSQTSDRVKRLISQATGLSPQTVTAERAQIPNYTAQNLAVSPSASPAQTSSKSALVDSAKKFLGTPYVWGGESMAEGGMDCSGFVYNALKGAGYNVGRDTAQGYRKLGTAVNKSDLKEGDLIFFGTGDKATHIGIYIGNGQMIHSSGGSKNTKDNPGKGVSIANVDYRSDFLEARRY